VGDRATEELGLPVGGGRPLRSYLDRFRRGAGVPEAVEDTLAELASLFAVLDEIEAEAAAIRSSAARSASAERDETAEEIEALLADAREQAEAERAEARKVAHRRTDVSVRQVLVAGDREARRIRAAGEERLPALVAEVVACVERTGGAAAGEAGA
jgi:hypothetical protein